MLVPATIVHSMQPCRKGAMLLQSWIIAPCINRTKTLIDDRIFLNYKSRLYNVRLHAHSVRQQHYRQSVQRLDFRQRSFAFYICTDLYDPHALSDYESCKPFFGRSMLLKALRLKHLDPHSIIRLRLVRWGHSKINWTINPASMIIIRFYIHGSHSP